VPTHYDENSIQAKRRRWSALELERASWFTHWQEIGRYLLPRAGRFLVSDRNSNRGQKKHNHIYDSHGTRALRVLEAGLMAGMTSPARPWFRLQTPDDDLNEQQAVKEWLHVVTRRMRDIFNRSNTYRALHSLYGELGAFGTAVNVLQADFETVVHHNPLTIGEYAIATDSRGNVDTLYRKYGMTVLQVVQEFGLPNVSQTVRGLYNDGKGYDKWIDVVHVIEPRTERDTRKRDAINMPWRSCYFEANSHEGADKYLRESGLNRFRCLAPRWHVVSGDIYGESPGMEALGDVKQLQHEQYRKGQVIDQQSQPALQVPTALKNQEVQSQPGGITYLDGAGPGTGIRALHDVRFDLSSLLPDIVDVRQRISRAFYEDLFLMLAHSDRREITAREVAERHEEKLLMLGPVLERLHNELLSPLVDNTFDDMIEANMVPRPPPELEGIDLKVEFISTLAQAQRAVGLASVDRLLGTVGSAAQFKPDMLDKIDGDQVVDAYADMLGVDPTLIVADDQVAIIRQQRAEQEAAMQQAAMVPAAAATAKTLSETDTSTKSALTDAMKMF
jgi:hypothetical protein